MVADKKSPQTSKKASAHAGRDARARLFDRRRSVLIRVLREFGDATTSLTLADAITVASKKEDLENVDRAWVRDMASGVLRRRSWLEAAVRLWSKRDRLSGNLRWALLSGAYQLQFQSSVRKELAVSEWVDFVKASVDQGASGFVNAILRRLSENPFAVTDVEVRKKSDPWEHGSVPKEFWDALTRSGDKAWASRFLTHASERPDYWAVKIGGEAPQVRRLSSEDLGPWSSHPPFDEFLQNISSFELVEQVARFLKSRGIDSIVDRCAAPGGKTMGLAAHGLNVVAVERVPSRLRRLEENVARVREAVAKAHTRTTIATQSEEAYLAPAGGPVSGSAVWPAIWIDAPCSSSGVIQRHPEIRWSGREKNLAAFASVQEALIRESLNRLRPGGVLVYSVCSVFREEFENVLAKFAHDLTVEREIRCGPAARDATEVVPGSEGLVAVIARKNAV